MLQEKTLEIAIRLYENKAYGTTFGKGKYRRALYNGTIDIKTPITKYLIDLYNYDDWANQAKVDHQIVVLESVQDVPDKLYSWLQRYDLKTKSKSPVPGLCTLDLQNLSVEILICDEAAGVEQRCSINAKPCKQNTFSNNAPQLLATNTELIDWR